MALANPFHQSLKMIAMYERMLDEGMLFGAEAVKAHDQISELKRDLLELKDFSFVDDPDFPISDFNRIIEVPDDDGGTMQVTLLSLAARTMKSTEVVRILYSEESNADPNLGDPTPLMAAMANTKGKTLEAWDMMDTLIDWGADVNAVSAKGDTALTVLAEADGDPDTARRLMSHGADPALGAPEKVERLRAWMENNGLAMYAAAPGV